MKKIVILLVFLAVLIMGVFNVHAKSENSAVVINDVNDVGGCFLAIANEVGTITNFIITDNIHMVETNSKNNNTLLTCHGQLPKDQAPKRTIHLNSENTNPRLICYTSFGPTSNWKSIITPSGHVKLTCHYKDTTE
ncbi:MAG: hypothetical protein KAS15_05575 [Nanoarchaeota archaeon]|nr:hypothetical protein [Nanoarchaeota archaeon]